MGFSSIALAALALGAAAQSTAGAYGQCKLHIESQCSRDGVTDITFTRRRHRLYRTKRLWLRIYLYHL